MKKLGVNRIMGDFYAEIGEGTVEEVIGECGLGTRNDSYERLIQL